MLLKLTVWPERRFWFEYGQFSLILFLHSVIFLNGNLSAHQLYVETGWYCNPSIPRENRFYFHCKNVVEDEKHFLYLIVLCINMSDENIQNYLILIP